MQSGVNDETTGEAVMAATRALVGIAARSIAAVSDDATVVQLRVLVLIEGKGSQTMGQLAEILGVNPSTVTRVCDVLVDKKLITRGPAKDNRRTVSASLTPRGRRLVEQMTRHRRRLIDEALEKMTPEGRRRLARGLSEFAVAAGEVSEAAWTLGWSMEQEGLPEPR